MAVAVDAAGAVLAAVAVGRAAAPFAVLLVVDVLVEVVGSVLAAVAVGRAIAVSASSAHGVLWYLSFTFYDLRSASVLSDKHHKLGSPNNLDCVPRNNFARWSIEESL